jgi:hypothetical protein
MVKYKLTILFIALMSVSSTSGAFTAICHGSDGHIAVEPLAHNHCECPETSEADDQDKAAGGSIVTATDHGHCKDSIATSNFIFSIRKNVKTSICKVFSANLFLKSNSTLNKSLFGYLSTQSHELSSFFTPLRTVILLA